VPTVAEEPNLEVLGSTAVALVTESNALSFRWAMGHGCHADVFRRTDGRLNDGRGGVRDLDAL
jgi:hypothetical protein